MFIVIKGNTPLTCHKTIVGNRPACSTSSWLTHPARGGSERPSTPRRISGTSAVVLNQKLRLKQAPALQQAICWLSFSGCNSQHVTGASPYDKPFPCDMVSPSCPPWEIAAIKAFSATDPDLTWQDRIILSKCCFAPRVAGRRQKTYADPSLVLAKPPKNSLAYVDGGQAF